MSAALAPVRAYAFGLVWQADTSLDHFAPCPNDVVRTDVVVQRVAELPPRKAVATMIRGAVYSDGVRFRWEQQVTFDLVDGHTVNYLPGPEWRGRLPASFFSTLAALTLVWRGALAFHACAVAIDGKAVLISGAAGAGKSTLTAGLVALGARFLSDDLSVLDWNESHKAFVVHPGRQSLRLHPVTAQWLSATHIESDEQDMRGKLLVTPAALHSTEPVTASTLLILRGNAESIPVVLRPAALGAQLFRPKWQSQLPMQAEIQKRLRSLAGRINIERIALGPVRDRSNFENTAQRVMDLIRSNHRQ